MSKHLLIRADANVKIGTGHVMRCLALAQAWQDAGGTASIAARELPEGLKQRLLAEQIEVIPIAASDEEADAQELVSIAKPVADCVVVDGYAFGIVHQRALREAGIRQLFIDDYGHSSEYVADFVLNQNITADESLYKKRAAHTKLLLGTDYALLRREFRKINVDSRLLPDIARKVLVTLGGSDPENVTQQVLEALQQVEIDGLQVKALVGVANPNRSKLEQFSAKLPFACELLANASMPELMSWADIAVTATGTTIFELLYMKVPFVGIAWADNQRPAALRLREVGQPSFLWPEDLKRDALASCIQDLAKDRRKRSSTPVNVDGKGGCRVCQQMWPTAITMTPATQSDCALLFDWANDPTVRSVSFQTRPITWEEHEKWFSTKLKSSDSLILIGKNERGEPVGQIRFDGIGSDVGIDISISPQHRGLGFGTAILMGGINYFRTSHGDRLNAYVKDGNIASAGLFERCGFQRLGEVVMWGSKATHFVLD